MIINCPSCKTPVEVNFESGADDETLNAGEGSSFIHCPRCGEVKIPGDIHETRIATNVEEMIEEKLAHFSLQRLLGQGGFGTVWLAEDLKLGRKVALKVPVASDGNIKSLLHEAKTAARLKHQHIVSVYEVGLEEDQVFIASEYIEGMTLRDLLSTGKQGYRKTVDLLIKIAEALQHAHENGVIHRDIKPANIMIDRQGNPYVTDFGLAKKISADASISSEGQVLGTAKYMSPEQASGKTRETDHRTDVYAIGVILFEMLTTHPPFRGNVRAILHQKIFEEAPSPKTLDPGIPKDLETICIKSLEKDADKRYQSAQEFADELKRFEAGEPIKARPISTVEKTWRWCRRRPGVATLLLSLFLSLSTGLAGVSYFWLRAEESAAISNNMFYRSQMKLALQYLSAGDPDALKTTLFPFDNGQSLASLRGFEWDYYDKRADIFDQIVSIDESVTDVAISGNGELFAGCSDNRELKVWKRNQSEPFRILKLPAGKFSSISFSSKDNNLVTGSTDGVIRLWKPISGTEPIAEAKHGPAIKKIRFSSDGKLIASAGVKGAVRIRNSQTLEIVAEIPIGQTEFIDFALSPNSQEIAIATDNDIITVWKIEGRQRLHRSAPMDGMTTILYQTDGKTVLAGRLNGQIVEWSLPENQLVSRSSINLGAVGDIEISPLNKRVYVARETGLFYVYDDQTYLESNRVSTHVLNFGTIDQTRSGKFIVAGSGDGSIKVMRMDELALPDVTWCDSHIRDVAVLPDGKRSIAIIGDKNIEVMDYNTLEKETLSLKLDESEKLISLSVQPQGNLVAIAGNSPVVRFWDVKRKKFNSPLPLETEEGVKEVQFSPDGKRLAVFYRPGHVWIYDTSNFEEPEASWEYHSKISAVQFLDNSEQLIVALENGTIQIREVNQVGSIHDSVETTQVPQSLCYCPHTDAIVAGTNSGDLIIWEPFTSGQLKTIKGHVARINDLIAFPDGKRFASASRDRLIKIWDAESADQITSLNGHTSQIFALAMTGDGQSLLSTGLSGDFRIWRGR